MGIKMIVSDIDGTLVDSSEAISEALTEAVDLCRSHGIIFTLATGRTRPFALPFVKALSISQPYILANGAGIFRGEECLAAHDFSALPIMDLVREADRDGLTVTFSDPWDERALRETEYVRMHQKLGKRFTEFIDIDTADWDSLSFLKIMFRDEDRTGKIVKYRERLQAFRWIYEITTYSDRAVELSALGCSKASGLAELARMTNIDMADILACGDHDNDIKMLKAAGIGAAVGNANAAAKEAADYVANAQYAAGVLEALKRFCL